jgi:kynurenine formamidase
MAKNASIKRSSIKVSKAAVDQAFKDLSNWGRWGKDDQIGTLNYVTPADIIAAARLVKKGRVFGLGMPLGQSGPQRGLFGKRWNPIHTMLATGTDAVAGRQGGLLYSDDAINMPIQSATHWDSLGHIFYHDQAYNGHKAIEVDANGLSALGIEHAKDRICGRGVLLDMARFKKVDFIADGVGISNEDLDACAKSQGIEIKKADFVLIRTGQMENCLKRGDWGGYAGGDAPGLKFESCYWLHEKQVAAVCTDTWGVEVRPNETKDVNQPWHWVVIPAMGLYMGEMFVLSELAADCAKDKAYEFFFNGAPLVIPGGTGSPVNPQAIK